MSNPDDVSGAKNDRETDFYNFAVNVVDKWAEEKPGLDALLWVDDSQNEIALSYKDISSRSKKLGGIFGNYGIKKGDVVLVLLGRHITWWETITACLRTGVVAAPATTQLSEKDIAFRIRAASAKAVITDQSNAQKVDAIAGECPGLEVKFLVDGESPGWVDYRAEMSAASCEAKEVRTKATDDALCYFTSGTTGYPKMVVHNQGYGLAHQITGSMWLNLREGDLHWNISDTGWAKAAWSSYFGPWHQGATLVVYGAANFDARSVLSILDRYPITSMCAAPTVYRMLVLENLDRYNFEALRSCVAAGEPLNPETIATWGRATGVTIRDGYGQTESIILCGAFPGAGVRAGSMGKPTPGITLGIVDDEGCELADSEEGHLAVRVRPSHPVGLFHQYRGDDAANVASFVGDWYLTGDRAYRDADGYFWFVGRADDVIISSGYRIGPFEVESALVEHEAVAESAVVSSPDELRGEVVKAFVVLKHGYKPSDELVRDIQAYVKNVTAPYKYPRKIEFVPELPKTVSGKIRRVDLRQAEWAR